MRNAACVTFGLALVAGGAWNHNAFGQANMARTHIGHVMDSFQATPNQQGLLTTALAEAKIAAQHAALAVKTPDNLDAMKLHAGHVINALDAAIEMKGPGLGYGVKKAAAGVAQHVDLAAKSEGASANVKMHAVHVSSSANNVTKRADEAVAVAQKIRSATSAAEASMLVSELSTLVEQLTAGFDANKDGRITWETGEGGLQQAQQHMELMRKGEGF